MVLLLVCLNIFDTVSIGTVDKFFNSKKRVPLRLKIIYTKMKKNIENKGETATGVLKNEVARQNKALIRAGKNVAYSRNVMRNGG
jgi:D-ribose pyranose/furanose isomerase RbsD